MLEIIFFSRILEYLSYCDQNNAYNIVIKTGFIRRFENIFKH